MKIRKVLSKVSNHIPSFFVLASILFSNVISPAIVIAEELILPQEDTTIIVVDESEDILNEGISDPESIAKPEVLETWVTNGNNSITSLPVVLGEKYIAPQNSDVSVTFTRLPEVSSTLSITELILTQEEIDATGAISDKAYDIRTDMVNGTFEYDLTLPKGVTNPTLSQACGLDIALVIDNSTSIDSGEMTQIKNAMTAFTNALNGTPTWFSVTSFATTASVLRTFTGDISSVNSAISSIPVGGGYTNWQDSFVKASGTFDPRLSKPNLVIFASDGNPNRTGTSGTSVTEAQAVSNAALVADAIKTSGTRILAIGVGSDLNTNNMIAISGPSVDTGNVLTSDVITSDFSTLADDLGRFASQTCGGTITINKYIDSVNSNNLATEPWTFTTNVLGYETVQTTDGSVNFPVPVGTNFSITESSVNSGYSFGSASCKKASGSPVGTPSGLGVTGITMSIDDIISCDFVNTTNPLTGTVIVHKDVVGPHGEDIYDTQTYGVSLDGAVAMSIGDEGSVTYENVIVGNHTITEPAIPAGSTLLSISPDNDSNLSNGGQFTLGAGETKDIYVVNRKNLASIYGHKYNDVDGNGIYDSSIDTPLSGWTIFLDANSNGVLDTTETRTDTNALGEYSFVGITPGLKKVCEVPQTGWVNSYPVGCHSITVGTYEAVENVNFLNYVAPTLTLVKTVTNDNGGTKLYSEFPLFINGIFAISGTAYPLLAGVTYTATETNSSGYTPSDWTGDCNSNGTIVLAPGENKTCTINNDDKPGTLIVKKIINNNYGGTLHFEDFSFSINNGISIPFENDGQNDISVSAGEYSITEDQVKGYESTYNNCDKLLIGNGETVTCTITNNDIQPKLTVTKTVIGGTKVVSDFSLFVNTTSVTSGVQNGFNVGSYIVNETPDSDYNATFGGDCGSNGSITLALGEEKECTITNTRKQGYITFEKNVTVGNEPPSSWTFSVYNEDSILVGTYSHLAIATLDTGSYTVVENGPSSYFLDSIGGSACSASVFSGVANLTVSENGGTCIFGNSKKATITINKTTLPANSDSFNFTVSTNPAGYTGTTALMNGESHTFTNLMPGLYNIEESINSNYTTVVFCNGVLGGPNSFMDNLTAGEDLVCNFTNTKKGEIIVEKQVLPDGHAQTFPFSGEVSGTISDGQQLSKVVVPGTYNVSESPFSTSGFRLTSIVCEDNNSVGDITTGRVNFNVEPGETVKCTFTNEIFGSITGHKYHDLNQNGLQGIDEPDLSGWEMKIYSGSDCQEGSYLRKANTNSSGDITFYSIIPGDYSMEETLQTGWSNISNICQNFTVTPAEAEIVNFGNIQLGSITVIKTDNLDSGQDFTFNYTPTGSSTTQFILDDDNNTESTYSDSTTYSNLLPNFYNIDEVVPSGWTSSIVDCTSNYPGLDTFTQYENGAGTMHTALRPGENLVCTFENIRDTGTLQVLKNVDLNADGDFNDLGETGATDWLWQIDGGIDHNTGDPALTIPTGTYHLTETNQTNFHVTGLSCIGGVVDGSDVNITKDANVICTFTNVRDTGRVTFIKTVDQGPAQPSDWTFSVYNENDELLGDTYSSGNTYTIETGSYHVEESSVQGYSFDSATGICSFDASDGSIVLTVSTNGGTCTISNLRDTGSILVHKFEDSNTNGEIDANEGGLEGWEMGIYAGFGCNGQVIQNGFQSTDNRGDAQFDNIVTGEYSVMETPQEDWITTTPLCQDINVNFGETTSVNVGNAKLSDIHGYKWNDFDEDGYLDTCDDRAFLRVSFDDEETIADTCTPEPLLSGWTINLYKWNGDEYSSEPIKSMDTDSGNEHFGWYWFEDLLPGQYKICEVPQSGWNQTYPINEVGNCHVVNLPDDNSYAFTVSLNYVAGPEYNFGNNIIPPQLQIEKTNDTGGLGMNTGDVVTYTITVKAPEDDIDGTYLLEDIILTDLLPEGFEYILGSWTGTASEPIYNGLPAKWNIGDMQEGDTKVLTYKAVISSTQQPGIYPDIAWVSGEDILGAKVLGISTQDPQENFVGTEVLVIAEEELEEGEVLGASTEVTLPSTGANTYLTLGAIISMIIGFLLLIVNPKKKIQTFVIVTTLLLGIGAFTKPTPTYAVAEKVEVKIGMPQSPTNKDSFNISFVALNLTGDPIEIKCYEETKGLFATYIAERGNCPVDDTIITTSGTYKFYVTAKTGSTTAQSSTVTVVVDLDMPTPITSYTKTQGPCSYILTFTTGNGSKVQIFRSTVQPFIANASTLIKELSVLPNQNVTYTDIVPVCDQEYFYAIRTVDTVGNPSVIVTDAIVKTVQAPPTTTTPATTVTTPGTTIPVTEDEEVAGEDISVDEEVLGEQQTVEDETPVTGEVSDDTENTEDKKNNTVIYIIAIVLLGSIGYIYVKNRKSTY